MIDITQRIDRLSDEQRMILDSAVSFYSRDADYRRIRQQKGLSPGYSTDIWQEMAELGWLGLCLPHKYGGMGLGFGESVLILEQAGRALAPEPLVAAVFLGAGSLLHGDNESLKAEWLPRLVSGQWTPALAWQEGIGSRREKPGAVSASRKENGFLLSGKKSLIPEAAGADAFVLAATTPDGPALFLVDKNAQGMSLEIKPRVDGGFFGELRLDRVQVPDGRCVASPAIAEQVLERILDEARLGVSAELVGLMFRALEISIAYIKQREQFGRPVGSFQALQHRAVDLLILAELSRSVMIQGARVFDSTHDFTRRAAAASQAKARCSDAALKVAKGCIQLHGGIGYTDECNIGLFLKRAMVLAAWLGNADHHRRRYGQLLPEADG